MASAWEYLYEPAPAALYKNANVAGPHPEPPQGHNMWHTEAMPPGSIPPPGYMLEANAGVPYSSGHTQTVPLTEADIAKQAEFMGIAADIGLQKFAAFNDERYYEAMDNLAIEDELQKVAMLSDEEISYWYGEDILRGRDMALGQIGGLVKAATEANPSGINSDPVKEEAKAQLAEVIAENGAASMPPAAMQDPQAVQEFLADVNAAADETIEEMCAQSDAHGQVAPMAKAAGYYDPYGGYDPYAAAGYYDPYGGGGYDPYLAAGYEDPNKVAAPMGGIGREVGRAGRWAHDKITTLGNTMRGRPGGVFDRSNVQGADAMGRRFLNTNTDAGVTDALAQRNRRIGAAIGYGTVAGGAAAAGGAYAMKQSAYDPYGYGGYDPYGAYQPQPEYYYDPYSGGYYEAPKVAAPMGGVGREAARAGRWAHEKVIAGANALRGRPGGIFDRGNTQLVDQQGRRIVNPNAIGEGPGISADVVRNRRIAAGMGYGGLGLAAAGGAGYAATR